MKRFPRAVPEALIALLLVGGACSPSSNVKPGAPVLTQLSLVLPDGSHVDVTADTPMCDDGAAEGKDCDPGKAVCELGANVVCQCMAKDMCDPSINPDAAATGGTLNCTYPSLTKVLAVFDRLLDTTAFEAMTPVASLTSTQSSGPKPNTAVTTNADYNPAGISKGLLFTPAVFGSPTGPNITITGAPAVPTDSTVTISLDKTAVLAKDKKTPFTGPNLLADGTIAFKTATFEASIAVPAPPPPMDMGTPMPMPMGCPDAGTMMAMDAGTADGGGNADAAADAAPSLDASIDVVAAVTDAGAASEAGAASDAGAAPPPPPSTDVPADMSTAAITITFTNPVPKEILGHITITENGKPFTDFVTPDPMMFPTSSVAITPKTAWAPGKTYEITVDKDAADVLGKTLGAPVVASFTMSAS
jgi:hypothetical protein